MLSADGLLIGASSGPEPGGRRAPVRDRRRLPEPGPGREPALQRRRRSARPSSRWSRRSSSSPRPGRAPASPCSPTRDADIGLIAYEMAMLVTRVGESMTAPTRHATVAGPMPAECRTAAVPTTTGSTTTPGRWSARTRSPAAGSARSSASFDLVAFVVAPVCPAAAAAAPAARAPRDPRAAWRADLGGRARRPPRPPARRGPGAAR